MRVRGHIAGIASAAALALVVTGCSDSGSDGGADGDAGSSSEDTEAADTSEGDDGDTLSLAVSSETTTWTNGGGREHQVEITAESLVRGEVSDLEDIRLKEEQEGLIPHYVTFTVTAVGEEVRDPAVADGLALISTDGRAAEPLSLLSFGGGSAYPPACDRHAPETLPAGQSAEICQMYLLHEAAEPLRIAYSDAGSAPSVWPVEGAGLAETVRGIGTPVESGWTTSDDVDVPIEVAPVSVSEGTAADLADWDVDTDGKVPFYVTMEYRNDGEPDLYPRMNDGLELWTLSGKTARLVNLIDVYGRGVDACPKAVPDEMLSPGDRVRECAIYLVEEGDIPSVVFHHPQGEAPGSRAWSTGLV